MPIRRLLAALAIVGMFASGVGIASLVIFGGKDQQTAVEPRRAPPQPPPPSVPTVKEFLIGVTVTAQNCTPAAPTCVYTYTIDPKYVGLHPFPETPFTVEYQVNGGLTPQPGKFTVQGQKAEILKDVQIEGPPAAQLTAQVLTVTGEAAPPP